MTDSPKLRIAVVGGGIAGLALGGGLAKQDHLDIHVYESVPAYKDVGAGLALPLNALKSMALISPALQQAYAGRTSMQGDTDEEIATEVILAQGPRAGELVAELGRAKNRKTISRADLLEAFMQFVPSERLSFGKRLESIVEREDEIELTFTDKTTVTADCVLAADGIHSVTRRYLLGAEHPAAEPKNHDGWQIYRTLVTAEEAKKHINEKWTRRVPILLGPRGHINCIPLDRCTRLSAGVAVRGAKFKEGGAPALDPTLYADYSEDARRIVELVAKDTSASWTAADHDHAPYYTKGRIAMLGDSAHASLPFAGNGAAQALEDVAVLNYLFSRVRKIEHIEPALQAYDAVRRPRSQRVVDLARQFGRIYAYAEDGMHEDPARMKKFFAGTAAFINNADLDKQNEDAMQLFVSKTGHA